MNDLDNQEFLARAPAQLIEKKLQRRKVWADKLEILRDKEAQDPKSGKGQSIREVLDQIFATRTAGPHALLDCSPVEKYQVRITDNRVQLEFVLAPSKPCPKNTWKNHE